MTDPNLPPSIASHPRYPLMWNHPSPLHSLPRISREFSHLGITVWAKREDCNSGLAFGGNKIRKLEYIMAEAVDGDYDVVVTCGGEQSNSMRQVAAAAAKIGIKTILVQRPGSANWKEPSNANYANLGNVQITQLLSDGHTKNPVEETLKKLIAAGKKPYYVPVGGTDHPLGGLGFARFAFEIIQQEEEMGVFFDTIIVPSIGGSTAGGMLAGFRLAAKTCSSRNNNDKTRRESNTPRRRRRRQIIAMFTGSDPPSIHASLPEVARRTAERLGLEEHDVSDADYEIDSRFNAGAYGLVDAKTIDAMKLAGSMEGIVLDPVYTAKAFAGMLHKLRTGEIQQESHVLFVHTGGQSVLSAYSHLDLSSKL